LEKKRVPKIRRKVVMFNNEGAKQWHTRTFCNEWLQNNYKQ
jgi:hypothetical protein